MRHEDIEQNIKEHTGDYLNTLEKEGLEKFFSKRDNFHDIFHIKHEDIEELERQYNFYFNEQDYNKAAEIMSYLVLVEIHNPKFYILLGNAQFQLKNYDQAMAAYQMSVYLLETDPLPHLLIGRCFFLKNEIDKARDSFETALNLAKQSNTPKAKEIEELIISMFNANILK